MLTVLLSLIAVGVGPFERLQAKAPVERAGSRALAGWAGRYTSDPEIHWPPGAERQFVAVRRAGRAKEVVLVGTEGKLSYFEDNAADDPQLMILIVGLLREESLDGRHGDAVRKRLMRESWRPDCFRKEHSQ